MRAQERQIDLSRVGESGEIFCVEKEKDLSLSSWLDLNNKEQINESKAYKFICFMWHRDFLKEMKT